MLFTDDTIRYLRIKQRTLIRRMTERGYKYTDIYKKLLKEFGQMAFSKDSVLSWINKFRSDECLNNEFDVAGNPSTSANKNLNLYALNNLRKEKQLINRKEPFVIDTNDLYKIMHQ